MTSSPLRDLALRAFDAGLAVLPPAQDGSKRPIGNAWKQYQIDRPSRSQVEAWYTDPTRTGIGYVTGAVSKNLEILDFDDARAYVQFCDAAKDSGLGDLLDRIERGYSERTPANGVHLYYFSAEIAGNTKLACKPNPTEDDPNHEDVLIETRGQGGYIVAAPSSGSVHPTGKPYTVFFGSPSTTATITPAERTMLLELAATFDEREPKTTRITEEPSRTLTGSIRPGDDFNQRTTWHELLDPLGWEWLFERDGVSYLRRPGKSEGVSATVNWDGRDHLRVFTSSTTFEPGMFDRFGAYAAVHHNGDFARAAQDLSNMGYGTPPERDAAPLPARRDWPKMRDEAFHGLAGDIVHAFDPQSEADPCAVLATTLISYANAVGRNPHVMVGESRHGTNENVVIVGDTGKSRKGESSKAPHRVMRLADQVWADERCVSGMSSGEGVVWAIRDRIVKIEPIKEDGKIVGNREVEIDPGVRDKRLFVKEEEFSSALKQGDRQGNTLSETERRLWDSPYRIQSLTKNSPATATNPHVSILGHITVEELKKTLSETESVNGRANRYVWLCAKRSKLVSRPKSMDEETVAELAHRMCQALDHGRKKQAMAFSEDAGVRWDAIYPHLSKAHRGVLGSMTARSEAHTLRFALIYALLDLADEIEVEHLDAALALWDYSADSVLYLFGDATGDNIADKILTALREQGDLTKEGISELLSRNVPAARINNALDTLVDLRLATSYADPSPTAVGRRKTFWTARVNTSFSSYEGESREGQTKPTDLQNHKSTPNEINELDEVTPKEAA